jgi:predicted Ser/Thr protein kinase/TolA-binding protein
MGAHMLAPETHLGAYRLISRIGAGGMGEVWKGEDTRLGRIVAIKVLPPTVAADAEATARLRREARTAAQLYHPNIAMIHAIEQDGDRIFIVMEYVEGEPLSKVIKRGALSEAELCRIGRGVAEALAEAHAKGIVHRDIKPDNIMVNGPRVKVLDFGIAKHVEGPAAVSGDAPTTFVTQQGLILGTVHYMSPEQALGKQLDARTDIFSLGVVLYEGATGRLPFSGETATETMMHIIRDPAPDPATYNAAISPALKSIIDRCLRKNRDERFATAADLGAALEQQLGMASTDPYTAAATQVRNAAAPTIIDRAPVPPPPRKGGRWLWLALGAILLAVVIIGAIASRTMTTKPPIVPATKPAPAQPASAAAVNVTAPPPSQIVETKVPPPTTTTAPPITQSAPPPQPQQEQLTASNPPPPASARPAPPPPPRTGDDAYDQAMAQLVAGNRREAHEAMKRIVDSDPTNARAHFRLGQMAMFNHNFDYARREYEAAWANKEKLDPHDRHFVRLGMAIVNGNRIEARKVGLEIERLWPGDPELERIKNEFAQEPGREPGRPVRPRWRKP